MLFEIAAVERSYETLLSTQNLRSVTLGAPAVRAKHTPEALPKEVVVGEHFVLEDLPFYAAGNNNKRARHRRLVLPFRTTPGRLAGLNHSGPSICGRSRGSCAAALPPMTPPTEEMGAESQGLPPCEPSPLAFCTGEGPATRRSRPAHDLKSGLVGRFQDRFLETIEVSCLSVQDDHPEVVSGDGRREPSRLGAGPGWGGSPVDDAICISASSFSYVELEKKLKRIPPDSDVAMPSAKMFEAVEMRRNSEKELRLRLEQAEASLSAAREDNEALRVEFAEAKSRRNLVDARLHEAEDKMAQLRGGCEATPDREASRRMYIFSYRCCMKKHGIKRDVPSIPPGEEEKLRGKPAQ
ncbi:hypothetical protein CK203_084672 [Vitis vinifera]|uniref:Uncharacterized protein n=1 Tax=Vitis vinifera TaxID=29760 RepID=A0A438EU36_VITVI|nr:hypothetical protein CK203_084672 [Vitis vinifera]